MSEPTLLCSHCGVEIEISVMCDCAICRQFVCPDCQVELGGRTVCERCFDDNN